MKEYVAIGDAASKRLLTRLSEEVNSAIKATNAELAQKRSYFATTGREGGGITIFSQKNLGTILNRLNKYEKSLTNALKLMEKK